MSGEFARILPSQELEEGYSNWLMRAGAHHNFRPFVNERLAWAPLTKPFAQCKIALVSTAGVCPRGEAPFDVTASDGDPTFRLIPGDMPSSALMVSHDQYDHSDADKDINCVFPIDRLREFAAEGVIGSLSPSNFGVMGFNPDPERLLQNIKIAVEHLADSEQVDLVVMTPG